MPINLQPIAPAVETKRPLTLITPRPFLKWAGGKKQLLDQYKPFFPDSFNRYFEPFLGGGALYFHLQPEMARLSDINSDLINAYRCVRDDLEALMKVLDWHQSRHGQEHYYEVRAHQPLDRIERAARLIYITKTSFNGLLRYNKAGLCNSPIGRRRSNKPVKLYDRQALLAASQALQQAVIQAEPFETVLHYAKRGDFVFLDPPYSPLSATSNFTGYNKDPFTDADQLRLRDVCVKLARRGCYVMLANSDCKLIRKLYRRKAFKIHQVMAMRSINCKAELRGKIPELVITNYG